MQKFNDAHPFLLILIDFGLPFGGKFGEKIDEKTCLCSMLFFSRFWNNVLAILEGFLELLGGQRSLRSRSRRDLLKSEQKHQEHFKVLQKSRFAGPAVDAKMSLRSDLRPEQKHFQRQSTEKSDV